MTKLTCSYNYYAIGLDKTKDSDTFDLSDLPGNFDVSKTSNWSGGSVSGTILTVAKDVDTVTYKYNCGNGDSIEFTLGVVPKYTVTFDPTNGTGTMGPVSVNEGSNYILPECGFTAPEGKQFKGWATSANGDVITDTSIIVTGDTTLYAIWEDIYAVTINGSGTATPATAAAGTEITPNANCTRAQIVTFLYRCLG